MNNQPFKFECGDIVIFCMFSKIYRGIVKDKALLSKENIYKVLTPHIEREWFHESELYSSKAALIAALEAQDV